MINSRDINDLHPYVKYLAQKLITEAEKQNIKALVISTLRDDEYQATLYAQGRSSPGSVVTMLKYTGAHGKGLAFDVCQNIKGKEWENSFFEKIGRIGVALGLEWGGNWINFVDKPHFQYVQGMTTEQIRAGMMPIFPKIPVAPPPVPEWKEIIKKVASDPDKWEKGIETAVNAAKADGDLGALEIFKYLPHLIEKVYNKC